VNATGKERGLSLFKNQKRGTIDALGTIEDTNTFKLVRKIAEGGMGAVYEATQVGSDGFEKRMAIKTILEDFTTNEEFVEMFIGEAKLVADLIHQHIVQIYQLGKVGRQYYMAMEFIHGVNLEQFLAGRSGESTRAMSRASRRRRSSSTAPSAIWLPASFISRARRRARTSGEAVT
jgi:serine/threonine protein kinase